MPVMVHSYTDEFLIGIVAFFDWAKWLFLLAVCLTVGDLKFGIEASRFRKERIKRSRAVRRTLDKICSYVIWVVVAYAFGQAFGLLFGIELLPLIILLVIYGLELESIYVNYFASRGKHVKVNVFRLLGRKADVFDVEERKEDDEIK